MINLSSIDIANKNLVIRVDMNVPIKEGNILDATRIESCIPTINYVLENNAKVLLVSHLGRPIEGNFDEKFSLKPVAEYLGTIINRPCELIASLESDEIFNGETDIQFLENIRFFKGEKENCQELGNKLASLGDIYVFDAFGTIFAPRMGPCKMSFFHVFCICGPLRPHMAPLGFFWARFGRFFGPFCPSLGSCWLSLAPFGSLLPPP